MEPHGMTFLIQPVHQYCQLTAGRDLGNHHVSYYQRCNHPTDVLKAQPVLFLLLRLPQNKEEAAKFLDWFTNSIECNNILMAERYPCEQ